MEKKLFSVGLFIIIIIFFFERRSGRGGEEGIDTLRIRVQK